MYLFLDCKNGVSGDMTLAALTALGLDLSPLVLLLHDAGIDCEVRSWTEQRGAGPGVRVEVSWDAAQPLRHPADIVAIFSKVAVSEKVRAQALRVLDALTEAEAHAHGIPTEQVHFHEVGAIDTLVDVLGVAWGLEQLGISRVIASPLPLFSGWVDCDHGRLPLPAPATAYLLTGKPVFPTEATTELITPTGAALVHALTECGGQWPAGRVRAMGTGYGSRPVPCGLRAWLLEGPAQSEMQSGPEQFGPEQDGAAWSQACGAQPEKVLQWESHLDHLTGEELGAAIEALSGMDEVLDVLWLPGLTKKNRAGGLLRVLCLPPHGALVSAALLRHTHSLGLRWQQLERMVLPRRPARSASADWLRECGVPADMPAKAYCLEGREYLRPECDALKAAAAQSGLGLPALRIASVCHVTSSK